MKIELKNIGKIRSASIDLNGITVIAGENNTGKSTVSKALYSTHKSLYNASGQIYSERFSSIQKSLIMIYRALFYGIYTKINVNALAKYILDNITSDTVTVEYLSSIIMKAMERTDDKRRDPPRQNEIDSSLNSIHSAIILDEAEILDYLARNILEEEFRSQITNIYNEAAGEIRLYTDSTPSVFPIEDQKLVRIDNPNELSAGIVYIDDPFILDGLDMIGWQVISEKTHKYDLQRTLKQPPNNSIVNEILADKLLSEIHAKINSIVPGEIVDVGNQTYKYRQPGTDKLLEINNLSTGLKTFAILKTLLRNGTLEAGSTVILDEPEIHLHPEWQLVFAELIVLIRQKFHLHILLTTHSPYFLEAIEVYSAKYGIKDDCKYYLSHNEGEFSDITDVSEDIEQIYKLLAKPFQILEDARY